MGNSTTQTNLDKIIQNEALVAHSYNLSGSTFHRFLSSNAITFLPERVFENMAELDIL